MKRLAGYMTRISMLGGKAAVLLVGLMLAGQLPVSSVILGIAPAHAEDATGPVINSIVVEGNQRIERDTVLSYMTVRAGQHYSPAAVDQSLKVLFATGLFADINMRFDDGKLIVSVVENPIINRVAYEGNSAIKEEDLNNEVQEDVTRIIELYRRAP